MSPVRVPDVAASPPAPSDQLRAQLASMEKRLEEVNQERDRLQREVRAYKEHNTRLTRFLERDRNRIKDLEVRLVENQSEPVVESPILWEKDARTRAIEAAAGAELAAEEAQNEAAHAYAAVAQAWAAVAALERR